MASHSDPFQGGHSPSAHQTFQQQHHHHPSTQVEYNDVHLNAIANSAINPYYNAHSLNTPSSHPHHQQILASNGKFTEEWDASQRGSSIIESHSPSMQRSNSYTSNGGDDHLSLPSRGNTLKKKNSLRRNGSLKRSGSRRSMKAGSVRSLALQSTSDPDEGHSVFHCPVPTEGNPTEVLANRFQSWRKILKDLIAYYREIQSHYEAKSKSLLKLANVANNISNPIGFLASGGIDDAMDILRTYHKNSIIEANKAKEIEEDVILALTGLRSDLHQKIKEIKSLSGDFKNSVTKEMDNTRRAVKTLQDTIGQSDVDPASTTGKQDPFLLRLAVDRQVERQIDEENYLHQAYLNLESSGRELESIVVGEIQKAYNAYAGILKRESDAAYNAIDELRIGPISMPKDREWAHFVDVDDHFVNPEVSVRSAEQIHYPGQDHVACQEIRAGLLERKSKYLKSYTAGWYVLSPTHLHEFKSADKAQAPVMSLFLPEQKLGSHSAEGGSSNKFILKGRQTGAMHRGHTWVFRAETHDTMMAWYEDIKALTEKTPQERSDFVRGHTRSLSQSSKRSISSDGVVDEEDDEPFSADTVVDTASKQDTRRPQPGGRFPSDIQVNAQRGLQAPLSPSSMSSGFDNRGHDQATGSDPLAEINQSAGGLQTLDMRGQYGNTSQDNLDSTPSHAVLMHQQAQRDGVNPYTNEPVDLQPHEQRESRAHSMTRGNQDYQDHYSTQNVILPAANFQRSSSQTSHPSHRQESGLAATSLATEESRQPKCTDYDEGRQQNVGNNQPHELTMNSGTQQPGHYAQQADANMYNRSSGSRSTGDHYSTFVSMPAGAYERGADIAQGDAGDLKSDSTPATSQPRLHTTSPVEAHQQVAARSPPTQLNARVNSNPTISHLHIPGEYPKGTPTAETFDNRLV